MSLHAQLHADGSLELVNHLGIDLGKTPEEILARLERGDFSENDIDYGAGRASDNTYEECVRNIERNRSGPGGTLLSSGNRETHVAMKRLAG